jgi:integrase
VPLADRLARELARWFTRTPYNSDEDLVFAHPQTGKPIDRSKVTKRFQVACRSAGVRVITFHDLRHTFGTRLAANGEPLRTIQEFLGPADRQDDPDLYPLRPFRARGRAGQRSLRQRSPAAGTNVRGPIRGPI